MDRNQQRTSVWWSIVLLSLYTLTESRLDYNRGSIGAERSHSPSRTIHQLYAAIEQQQSTQLSAGPRPVVVYCHPDSMEVVVQADMFDTGLLVDGQHLSLGSDLVREGGACGAVSSGEAEFTLWAHLTDCGTKLSVSNIGFIEAKCVCRKVDYLILGTLSQNVLNFRLYWYTGTR